ncbi:hypothetical protein CEXT_673521 [Caerostris extrusa]|uniref:Uncharacterized protein n=1 Tax=Caerostris extrusa TaxID=172846 RepID=A0AAV4XRJ7_CAEEX|nr:hypothetical protein CEXT_673521 [Caerostris extrusa]
MSRFHDDCDYLPRINNDTTKLFKIPPQRSANEKKIILDYAGRHDSLPSPKKEVNIPKWFNQLLSGQQI